MLPVHQFAPLIAFFLPAAVSAHGHMSSPSIEFEDINNYYNQNQPAATVAGTAGTYTGSYVLRDLADENGSTCGYTNANAAVQAIPSDGTVKFEITAQHIGPCEIWLDDTKLAYVDECWTEYPSYEIPVDFSSCTSSSCQLRWVWLATHNDPWEIYDNCANVASSSSSASSSNTTTTAPTSTTTAPTSTTTAPTSTTTTPTSTTTAPTSTTTAPTSTTTAPTSTTTAPSSSIPSSTAPSQTGSPSSSSGGPGTVKPAHFGSKNHTFTKRGGGYGY